MLANILRVTRQRWKLVLAVLIIGIAGAVAIVEATQTQYQSSLQIFVSAQGAGNAATALANAYDGGLFTQQQVQSYVEVVDNSGVLSPVIREFNLHTSVARLANDITATAPTNTVLISISVRNHSPQLAERIANAVGASFISFVGRLEASNAQTQAPVHLGISDPASKPTSPVVPDTKLDLSLGVILGLAVGVGIALLLDRLSTRIDDISTLEAQHDVLLLATIPDEPLSNLGDLIHGSRISGRGEALRQLRTTLQFVNLDNPPRCIVVTSPVTGDGKTTTACSLAAVIADTGVRVLIVDADLRRPQVAGLTGIASGDAGVTTCLTGASDLTDAVAAVPGVPNYYALPAGILPPNPTELLASSRMADLVRRCREEFDFVVIDAPPVLPVADATLLSSLADGVIMIARYGATTHDQLDTAMALQRRVEAPLFGVVVNRVPSGAIAYGYPYAPLIDDSRRSQADGKPKSDLAPVNTSD